MLLTLCSVRFADSVVERYIDIYRESVCVRVISEGRRVHYFSRQPYLGADAVTRLLY